MQSQPPTMPVAGTAVMGPTTAQGVPWRPILPPEMTRKIKKWQCYNFALTMLQLACSVAIISIVSSQLQVVHSIPLTANTGKWSYACFAATTEHPATCQYAYSVASISIFAGFIVSLMQCLTLDCCGMGRVMESLFDAFAACWWLAAAATLTARADEANMYDVPQAGWRNTVVGLAWIAAIAFIALAVTNMALTNKLGKAYKEVVAQQQAAMAAAGAGAPMGVQMTPTGYPAAPPPGAAPPAGYAPAATPPADYPPAGKV